VLALAGAVAGLSASPWFILPALFIGLPVLVLAFDGMDAERPGGRFRSGFLVSAAFALGYFTLTLHWLGAAFIQQGGEFLLLMPFAVLALAALLALFWGVAGGVAALVWPKGPGRIVLLAGALAVAEWARGHLFTGFPFNLVGYALTDTDSLMQLDAVIGPYGLTLLALLIGFTPALLIERRVWPIALAVLALGAQVGFGTWRLATTPLPPDTALAVRLVQPMILDHADWSADDPASIIGKLTALSAPGLDQIDLLLWPESVFPFFLTRYQTGLQQIGAMLPERTTLLTGAPRDPLGPDGQVIPDNPGYNSILAIRRGGGVVASYDKVHLVPFGEYLPYPDFWRQLGINQFVPGTNGWAPGTNSRLMQVAGLPPFLALVCYEAIFPGDVGPVADAAFMLNVTNDAWFDGSVGPEQHAHQARLRAVETGMPLVRPANSGVSFVTDALGRITGQLPPLTAAVLDFSLPGKIAPPPYAVWGEGPFVLALGLFAVLAFLLRRGKRNADDVRRLAGT
jgi:apolipoprotein N-acyltransferase